MPVTQGTSIASRQVLGTVTGNETSVYVRLRTETLPIPVYRGFVSLEFIENTRRWQYQGKELYTRGVVFLNGAPFQLNTEIVCYWRVPGILWEAEWE